MVRRSTRFPVYSAPAPFARRSRMWAEQLESRDVPSSASADALLRGLMATMTHSAEVQSAPVLAAPPAPVARPLLHEPRGRYAIGTSGGGLAQVNVYDAQTNSLLGILNPFGGRSTLGVSVATGDVTGDGIEDIVVAASRGARPTVEVFDGRTLRKLSSFDAYSATFNGGVSVAVADVDGDGRADIITGAGAGSAAHVKVFSGAGLPTTQVGIGSTPPAMRSFFAFDAGYRGGITVAGGDVNGDGHADIVVGTLAGSPPHVKVFSGASGAELHSFYAWNPSYTGGISVAAGDINGDGRADIVVGASRGPTSQVRVFSGDNLIADYSAFTAAHQGARVGTQDIDGDGKREVIVVTGPNSPPRMRILNGLTGAVRRENPAMPSFYTGGLSVG